MATYQPPKQSGIGQFVDSIFLLALVYVSLLIPIVVDFSGDEEVVEEVTEQAAVTWQSLGQNEAMQAQWKKLGMDVEGAAEIINDKFDYTIDPLSLILTIFVIVGYFFFLFIISEKEYKEVIEEKFNNN